MKFPIDKPSNDEPIRGEEVSHAKRGDGASSSTAEQPQHPLGAIAGGLAGAAAGALSGVAAGPVGSLAGAAAGAALGVAAAAKGDTSDTSGARAQLPPLSDRQRQVAVQFGAQARSRLGRGAVWSDAEPSLRASWSALAAATGLSWEQVRATVEEGWNLRAAHQ